ncbi:MAG: hypothetical protein WC551_00755 [Patescibacteria group bacterium]
MVEENVTIEQMIGYEELVRLALSGLDVDEPLYQPVEEAVKQLLADPACPVRPLSHAEMDILESLIDELHESGSSIFGEAAVVSLRRLKLETGWKPEDCPLAAKLLAGNGETYLEARHAFGLLALAWQIEKHPQDVILTAGSMLLSIN